MRKSTNSDKSSNKGPGRRGDKSSSSPAERPERSVEARRLAVMIEEERRKLNQLSSEGFANPEIIRLTVRLEKLINEYMMLVRK